ncbi:MAG TPA: BPSS1780 family membrane protein [Burkholderiaceae bacterium]|nr:BPSS1780 family membrane protein [Burkholderiaceae bacterium]
MRAPAGLGWKWVGEGFALLRRRPLALLGLTVLFFFTLVLPSALPLVGPFAPLVLMPALSVGYMQAVRTAEDGRMPSPWTLYDALRARRGRGARPLLMLGLIYAGVTALALAVSAIGDGGTLFRMATGTIGSDDPALADGGLPFAAVLFLLVYTPVQMAMWYAPLFVAWHGRSPVQAMFYSLVGVWRNKAVFTVYLLGWFGVFVGVGVALRLLGPLLPGPVLPMLLSPLMLVMAAAIYCSFWPSYRDLVRDGPDAAPPAA